MHASEQSQNASSLDMRDRDPRPIVLEDRYRDHQSDPAEGMRTFDAVRRDLRNKSTFMWWLTTTNNHVGHESGTAPFTKSRLGGQ